MSRRDARRLTPFRALTLGLLHGPAELLPVSSSAHVAVLPLLFRGRRAALDAESEKALEVALHAGSALALLIVLRGEIAAALRGLDRRRIVLHLGAGLPPSLAGLALERPIERRLGTPATVAAGLAGGSLAMLAADRAPARRHLPDADARDGLWLGLAQACALVPGVSRSGATLAVLRARRFARPDAARLSREVALPVMAGATILKVLRLAGGRAPATTVGPLGLAATAAFASTFLARGLIGRLEQDRPLAPYAAYRLVLAAAVWSSERGRANTEVRAPAAGAQY